MSQKRSAQLGGLPGYAAHRSMSGLGHALTVRGRAGHHGIEEASACDRLAGLSPACPTAGTTRAHAKSRGCFARQWLPRIDFPFVHAKSTRDTCYQHVLLSGIDRRICRTTSIVFTQHLHVHALLYEEVLTFCCSFIATADAVFAGGQASPADDVEACFRVGKQQWDLLRRCEGTADTTLAHIIKRPRCSTRHYCAGSMCAGGPVFGGLVLSKFPGSSVANPFSNLNPSTIEPTLNPKPKIRSQTMKPTQYPPKFTVNQT